MNTDLLFDLGIRYGFQVLEQFATRSIPLGTAPTDVRLLNGVHSA